MNPTIVYNIDHIKILKQVIASIIFGIFTGVFLGEYCAILNVVGDIYVMLLECVVFPYLFCSLIYGLGSISSDVSSRLFRKVWKIFLLGLILSFIIIIFISSIIPNSQSIVKVPNNNIAEFVESLLHLLVPANLFESLSKNYVPAVVFFILLFGINTASNRKNSLPFLQILKIMSEICINFWNMLIYLAPITSFCLFASLSGTIDTGQLLDVTLYLFVFYVGVLIISFVLLPMLLTSSSNISYRSFLRFMIQPLLIGVATTLSVAALPLVKEYVKEILKKQTNYNKDTEEIVEATSSLNYAFCQLGNYFIIYLFCIFFAFYSNSSISEEKSYILPILSVFSGIGSPSAAVNGLSFMCDWLGFTKSSTILFVSLNSITRYGQVILSIMGIATVTILTCLSIEGKLKINFFKLLVNLLLLIAISTGYYFLTSCLNHKYFEPKTSSLKTLNLDNDTKDVNFTILRQDLVLKDQTSDPLANLDALERIKKTGIMRVGYNPNMIPFCYFNERGELVGFEVDLVYKMASNLKSKIVFIPFSNWYDLPNFLNNNQIDLAIGSAYLSAERLAKVLFSKSYFYNKSVNKLALITLKNKGFGIFNQIPVSKISFLGVYNDPLLLPLARTNFPNTNLKIYPDFRFPIEDIRAGKIQALLWENDHATALTSVYPDLVSVILPNDIVMLFGIMIPGNSMKFQNYINYWLDLKNSYGVLDHLYNKWINVLPDQNSVSHRWCIIRDVLHWVK